MTNKEIYNNLVALVESMKMSLREPAQRNDLLASGGSDYHNPTKPNRELGMYGDIDNRKMIPADILDKLLQNKDKYL